VVEDLARELKHGVAEVRDQAYKALFFQGPLSEGAALTLIDDDDPRIREVAANLLGNVPGPKSELALLRHLFDNGVTNTIADDQIIVSAAVIRSLARLGSRKLISQLVELLRNENQSVQLAAVDASVELRVEQAIDALIALLESPKLRLRAKALDRANPPSVPLTTQADAPATVMHFYSGPLMQFCSGVDNPALEKRIQAELRFGKGILRVARECGVGSGTVQRVKKEMQGPFDGVAA
jgi:hypothetical protein